MYQIHSIFDTIGWKFKLHDLVPNPKNRNIIGIVAFQK